MNRSDRLTADGSPIEPRDPSPAATSDVFTLARCGHEPRHVDPTLCNAYQLCAPDEHVPTEDGSKCTVCGLPSLPVPAAELAASLLVELANLAARRRLGALVLSASVELVDGSAAVPVELIAEAFDLCPKCYRPLEAWIAPDGETREILERADLLYCPTDGPFRRARAFELEPSF